MHSQCGIHTQAKCAIWHVCGHNGASGTSFWQSPTDRNAVRGERCCRNSCLTLTAVPEPSSAVAAEVRGRSVVKASYRGPGESSRSSAVWQSGDSPRRLPKSSAFTWALQHIHYGPYLSLAHTDWHTALFHYGQARMRPVPHGKQKKKWCWCQQELNFHHCYIIAREMSASPNFPLLRKCWGVVLRPIRPPKTPPMSPLHTVVRDEVISTLTSLRSSAISRLCCIRWRLDADSQQSQASAATAHAEGSIPID